MIALRGLHQVIRPYAQAAVDFAAAQGVRVEITSVTRSRQQQQQLYNNAQACKAAGLAGRRVQLTPGYSCEWPANPPGLSGHEYGLAWDSWVPPDLMPWWVKVREFYGWRVPANDPIHAEVPDWQRFVLKVAS